MRKILFAIFVIFMATAAWPEAKQATFSIQCGDSAGTMCYKILNNNNDIIEINDCDTKNWNIEPGKAFLIDKNLTKLCLKERIMALEKNCTDVQRSHFNSENKLLLSCASDTKYELIVDSEVSQTLARTADLSYNERLCISSGGVYGENIVGATNGCLCANNAGTAGKVSFSNDLGCVYTMENAEYIGTSSGYGGELPNVLCTASGGSYNNNQCTCSSDKQLVQSKHKTSCKCVETHVFQDPMNKQLGCVKKDETFNILGTVYDSFDNTIENVNILYNETQNATTDQNGSFNINVSNVSYIIFSHDGYKKSIYSAIDLKNNTKVILQSTGDKDTNKQDAENPEVTHAGEYVTEAPGRTDTDETDENVNGDTNQDLSDKLKSARDALAAAKEKENSLANKSLSAISTAATSLGAMQLAEGIAEKKADEEAEKQMRNYISTMKCEYGGGKHVDFGVEETLPGGNELLEYYTEYKTLADNLKTTKAALGLRAGIESEVLYDRAQSGLYQYASTGKTGGGETSLFRALTDSESEDATAWSEQKETASKKLKVGGGVAAGGAAVGVIGNAAINTDMIQNIKDAFKKD